MEFPESDKPTACVSGKSFLQIHGNLQGEFRLPGQVKFANNEPWRPFFTSSQISIFVDDNRGDGIQHAAIAVADIIPAVVGTTECS